MTRSDGQSSPFAIFDWGTTNLSVQVVGATGAILASEVAPLGVKSVAREDIPGVFHERMDLLHHAHGVSAALLVGMVGSEFGWQNVPMLPAPVTEDILAENLWRVEGGRYSAWIVPGVRAPSIAGLDDMMRGEETQAIGALAISGRKDAILCLPGTHTKWLSVRNGSIDEITTAMTGDIFAYLTETSVLRANTSASGPFQMQAFISGVEASMSGIGALQLAFSTRARSQREDPPGLRDNYAYLSGVLIGSEMRAMRQALTDDATLLLVGAPHTTTPYAQVAEAMGWHHEVISAPVAVSRGAARIFERQRLMARLS